MFTFLKRLTVLTALSVALGACGIATAATHPPWTKNCEAFSNKRYPHGVGKVGARDKVKGMGKPVTTFKRSTAIYKTATTNNGRLDGDKDGVACEKA